MCGDACGELKQLLASFYRLCGMNVLLFLIIVVAIVIAIVGGLVQSVNFLLWVGIVLALIAAIAWLLRVISGKKK